MTVLEQMKRVAKAESQASKTLWASGDFVDEILSKQSGYAPVIERIKPFIGSGMTQQQVADALGCTRGPIVKALKKLGARL